MNRIMSIAERSFQQTGRIFSHDDNNKFSVPGEQRYKANTVLPFTLRKPVHKGQEKTGIGIVRKRIQ